MVRITFTVLKFGVIVEEVILKVLPQIQGGKTTEIEFTHLLRK